MKTSRQIAAFLAFEYFALCAWISFIAPRAIATRTASYAFANWVAAALSGQAPKDGPMAFLYTHAYEQLLRGGELMEGMTREWAESQIVKPGLWVMEHYASVWGLLYTHAVWVNYGEDEISELSKHISMIRIPAEPESYISGCMDSPNPVLAAYLRQWESWQHPNDECNILCKLGTRMMDDQEARAKSWHASHYYDTGGAHSGAREQDRSHLATCSTDAEPLVEGHGYVRRPGAQSGVWSATGPAADYRSDS